MRSGIDEVELSCLLVNLTRQGFSTFSRNFGSSNSCNSDDLSAHSNQLIKYYNYCQQDLTVLIDMHIPVYAGKGLARSTSLRSSAPVL